MNRKDFMRNGFLGSAIFATSGAFAGLVNNKIDELKELDVIGFNHLPNTNSKIMNNIVIHKAETRGKADHDWLQARHTFSFANYQNRERMHFGVLRVLNDDIIDAGMGFGTHPHDNMEIITIPLEGAVEHKDSIGTTGLIEHGDIQVMSAGSGITHSEYNKNKDQKLKLLQIWLFPNKKDVTPRYDQMTLNLEERHNKFQQILSPNVDDAGVWIHQNAWFHLGKFDNDLSINYDLKNKTNGVYAFVVNGDFIINEQNLNHRDGMGIWNVEQLNIKVISQDAELLLMEVPMTF